MKFEIKEVEKVAEVKEEPVEFSIEIDSGGDLLLKADNENILWIKRDTGEMMMNSLFSHPGFNNGMRGEIRIK